MVVKKEMKMYYNRTLSDEYASHFMQDGELRWLFEFVKNHEDLDFFVGSNKSGKWISIYHGLTRILSIKMSDNASIQVYADKKYKDILPSLYDKRSIYDNFQHDIENLYTQINNNTQFERYYRNKKEGFYQNEFSRRYGICGKTDDDFVLIDREAVIGYKNQNEKDSFLNNIQAKYKQLQNEISAWNAKRYGKNLEKKAIGNELDFLGLDKSGNILLIEYKHGTNTSGIYLSPLQIGMYYDIFTGYPREKLNNTVFQMLQQKQKIGLINSQWVKPKTFKEIIPVLIISEYNNSSSAKKKFYEILQFIRDRIDSGFLQNLQVYNFTPESDLSKW